MSDDTTREILSHILERLDGIQDRLEAMGGVAAQSGKRSSNPTRKYVNEAGVEVFDTTGCTPMKDRDTAEDGFWVETTTGKSIPVDVQGYPLWLDDRPLALVRK